MECNPHEYAGKLKELATRVKKEGEKIKEKFEEIVGKMEEEIMKSKYEKKEEAKKALELFKNDRNGNKDLTNNITVEEIIPILWEKTKEWDETGKNVIFEQLADIILSGACPQGRCTRLLNLYPEGPD